MFVADYREGELALLIACGLVVGSLLLYCIVV